MTSEKEQKTDQTLSIRDMMEMLAGISPPMFLDQADCEQLGEPPARESRPQGKQPPGSKPWQSPA